MRKAASTAAISSLRRACLVLLVWLSGLAALPAQAEDRPKLGQALSAETSSITIWPDGQGLPQGSGNAAAGEAIYQRKCAACHGAEGQQGINTPLVGGQVGIAELPKVRTLGSYWPYATTLFDYIRRTMPYPEPGSLSTDEVYALVAYLLVQNGILEAEVKLDAEGLSNIQLPNRPRFYSEYDLP